MGATYSLWGAGTNWKFFAKHIREGMVVYDIGANLGQMMLLFASLVGSTGRVTSFEPVPALCEGVRRNIELNRLTNVEAICAAVGASEAAQAFMFTDAHPTQGKLASVEAGYQVAGAAPVTVAGMTLDGYVANGGPSPDVVKVDTEGAAAAVLRGAAQLIAERKPRFYVELHGGEEQAGVRDHLLARGYVAHTLDGQRVADVTRGWHSPLWCHHP
jgi:FkbM family methyltransferase